MCKSNQESRAAQEGREMQGELETGHGSRGASVYPHLLVKKRCFGVLSF